MPSTAKNSLAVFISAALYIYLAYFGVREQFLELVTLVLVLFVLQFFLLFNHKHEGLLYGLGWFFRLLFLFATPFLSQDFYRFLWDGEMLLNGVNPYLVLPKDYIQTEPFYSSNYFQEILKNMGGLSAGNHTNYPPLNQLIFACTAWVSKESVFTGVIVLRLCVLAGDFFLFKGIQTLLQKFNYTKRYALLFWLSPFTIIEFTGNLHFESVMLAFFVWSLVFLFKNRLVLSAVLLALSIHTKLIPLLFLPFFVTYLKFPNWLKFYGTVFLVLAMGFFPFISKSFLYFYGNSVGLWFVKFEFNASFYYLIREIGFYVKGYNIIQTVGKITPLVVIGLALLLTFWRSSNVYIRNKNLVQKCFYLLLFYFLIATTVHPWYILNLFVLGILYKRTFVLLWCFTGFLSYFAYSNSDFAESYVVLFVEYGSVILLFGYEYFYNRKHGAHAFWNKFFHKLRLSRKENELATSIKTN